MKFSAKWLCVVALFLNVHLANAETRQSPLTPKRFAIIFNAGYGSDKLPQQEDSFEKFVSLLSDAHFNVLLCKYEPWRAKICKKYDMQIMVDLLVGDHHIYKNVKAAETLCKSLKGNDVVYGYHLWSDNIGNSYPGRSRDVKMSMDGTIRIRPMSAATE